MKRLNQHGRINSLFLPFTLTLMVAFLAGTFGLWAFLGRQDYKNNVDKKIAAAVVVAKQQTATEKDNEFAEKEKSPLKSYKGPEAYGSINFSYPKTWSALISEGVPGAAAPIDGYFYPNFLPGQTSASSTTAYALRLEVISQSYDQVMTQYNGQVAAGALKAVAFKPEKVSGSVGVRLDGTVGTNKTGVMVVLPLRDKTLKISTESAQYIPDFENSILKTLTFVP